MKFYSHTNENGNYTKAISLESIRSVELVKGDGKSAIRFSVLVNYQNGSLEAFNWLLEAESKKIYDEIVKILNE